MKKVGTICTAQSNPLTSRRKSGETREAYISRVRVNQLKPYYVMIVT